MTSLSRRPIPVPPGVVAVVAAVVLLSTAIIVDADAVVPSASSPPPRHHHLRIRSRMEEQRKEEEQEEERVGASPSRFLGSVSMCGTNWSDANDTCLDVCESDEDCGPGRYCFHYMECTPPQAEAEAEAEDEDEDGALVYEEELSSFQQ